MLHSNTFDKRVLSWAPFYYLLSKTDITLELNQTLSLKLDMYDKTTYKLKLSIVAVYSIWFDTLQLFWLWVFTCKDVCQQAKIVGRYNKIVAHSGIEPAIFRLQTFRFPNWATPV